MNIFHKLFSIMIYYLTKVTLHYQILCTVINIVIRVQLVEIVSFINYLMVDGRISTDVSELTIF